MIFVARSSIKAVLDTMSRYLLANRVLISERYAGDAKRVIASRCKNGL